MFEKYIHTSYDLQLIEKSLYFAVSDDLSDIYDKRDLFESVTVISFDSKEIFVWVYKNGKWEMSKYNHSVEITDKDQRGWSANVRKWDFVDILPKELLENRLKISGGLPTPLMEIHKSYNVPEGRDIYISEDSYISTISHEFGHAYYNFYKTWYFSDKERNLKYLETAKQLFQGLNPKVDEIEQIILTEADYITEIFAFCVEYEIAKLKLPAYKSEIDRYLASELTNFIEEEKEIDLSNKDSVLADSHTLSWVIGRILIEKYPNGWKTILLKRKNVL
jgi:hypothetical protein